MQLDLTEEQRLLRDTCRDFADKELRPNAKRWDREHRYPEEAVKKAFELGLAGVAVPAQWGGAGMDNVAYALAIEEISRGCASVGVTLSVNNSLYCDPVLRYGTAEQKERWLGPFARGDKLGCFGLTEPQAGSDAAEQRTTAVRNDYLEGPKVGHVFWLRRERTRDGRTTVEEVYGITSLTRAEADAGRLLALLRG